MVILSLAVVLSGCSVPTAHRPTPAAPALPSVVAVLGDSISRGVDATTFGATPASAWATGMDGNDSVLSFAERLQALQPNATVRTFNDAEVGAAMADLASQANAAVEQKAQLVLVLMGANDVCSRRGMTSLDDARAQFDLAATTLRASGATVLVLSIPDVARLWDEQHQDDRIQRTWDQFRECPRVLSTNATTQERDAARAQIAALDAMLREESARFGFLHDGGAVTNATLGAADLSPIDAFHPSLRGHARLAELAWSVGPYASRSG